jgi:hypothetical protein
METNELIQNGEKAYTETAEGELSAEQLQGIVGGLTFNGVLACRKAGGDSIIAI